MLSCRDREYAIEEGSIVLFNLGDSHACVQSDEGTFDYRGFNISKEVMLDLAEWKNWFQKRFHFPDKPKEMHTRSSGRLERKPIKHKQ